MTPAAAIPVFLVSIGIMLAASALFAGRLDHIGLRLGLLAARRGLFDPAVLGGAAASMPDLEHVVPWLRPRGEKIFHRGGGNHGVGMPVETQLLLAGLVVGLLLARRR